MLAGRGHLIMFQQQLVVSEQQMPRHPTAINPPTGRQPAGPEPQPSPRRRAVGTHGRGGGGTEARGWPLHRRASLPVSPAARRPSVFLCRRQEDQLGSSVSIMSLHVTESVCVCVCAYMWPCSSRAGVVLG